MATRSPIRFPLMAAGMIALLMGLWAGLLRLGWALPAPRPPFAAVHGPLMVCGFLGTLIGVERAVALGRPWAYAAPLLSGLGALAFVVGLPAVVAPALMAGGSLGLVVIFAVLIRAQPELFTVTMGLGAVTWLIGNILWLGGFPVFRVVSCWLGFPVLTIAGERVELSRLLQPSRASRWIFLAVITVFAAGLTLGGVSSDRGARVTGVALMALTAWLLRHDVARRTVRQTGLPRFTAVCLLSGYVWLGVGGLLAFIVGGQIAGLEYDAVLHAVFLGFVFAMIFGHAPIIFPAVLGLPVPFRSIFYAHLAMLHLSVLLRLCGDLMHDLPARQWGGLLNAVAVLFFLANTDRARQLDFTATFHVAGKTPWRWDPETGAFPEVDMEADDPEAKISRKHALIRIENGKITVEDIGSLNGTYVNRQPRLAPGNPVELKSGDEIIIGKTFLKLTVEPLS